jgi:ureidoacrylate peracid hydrolase
MFRDYVPVLLEDCTAEPFGRAVPTGNHEASLRVIEALLGWVSNSDLFIKAVEARHVAAGPS